MSLAVLLLLLSAAPADAPVVEPKPPPPPLAWPNYVVPVLENGAICFGLLAFSNLVTHEEFALVTSETIKTNVKLSSWTIDQDLFTTNQFGHALQGNYQFNTARSSGLGFWTSALYATVTSLFWEIFFESEAPSVGDQLTTPMAGSMLGEALHRAGLQLRTTERGPKWLNMIGAFLLDPFGVINADLLGPSSQRTEAEPLFVRFRFGASAHLLLDQGEVDSFPSAPQALVDVLLVSGAPWNVESTYRAPLSYFDLRANLIFPVKTGAEIFVHGMLVGQRFGKEGAWGLFGVYDYSSAYAVRASGVGIGPGVVFQARPFTGWYLQTAGTLAGSPFAAAGKFEVPADEKRNYHVGVGMQASLDFRLVRPKTIQLELSARHWLVMGTYLLPNGFEAVTWVTAGATVPIWHWLGIGADFTFADRRAHFDEAMQSATDVSVSGRLFITMMSEPLFGIR